MLICPLTSLNYILAEINRSRNYSHLCCEALNDTKMYKLRIKIKRREFWVLDVIQGRVVKKTKEAEL